MLASTTVWLELVQALKRGEALEGMLPPLEAILRFTRDLQRRLGDIGVDGISGALGLYRQLAAVFDGISSEDLARLRADVQALERAFENLARTIESLRRLKEDVRP